MNELSYTLTGDGPSDEALLPILSWLLAKHLPQTAIQPQWADLQRLPQRPRGLRQRVTAALELYPADLLFIHRDAEREPPQNRVDEIRKKMDSITKPIPYIPVVPVRMTEALLLFDEDAIRRAAGNPNGCVPLDLPSLREVEELPDPKETLRALLRKASGLSGRRLPDFHAPARRVAELIDDFSPLRAVPAFQRVEEAVEAFLRSRGLA